MLSNIFNILVFVVFFIEIFISFTVDTMLNGIEQKRNKVEIGWDLISGYILRTYMAYALLRGLFL